MAKSRVARTKYAEVNQLASLKASRSAAMVDCVVVSPDIFEATNINQQGKSNSMTRFLNLEEI